MSEEKKSLEQNPRAALWPNYSPPTDLVFSHGIGSELITEEGDVYLDFLSGIAVTSFGHAHPHLVEVLHRQSEKLWHLSNLFRIPGAERLASRLAAHCFAERIFFANSGTEAVEAGIKAIRGFQASQGRNERSRIIGFSESFHGRTLAALAAAGNKGHIKGFIPSDYGFDQVEWGNISSLENAIGDHTAGIILEPVQGEGGIRPVEQKFLEQVRGLCDQHGLLLMFDEIQCGVGRSGKLFAHQHYGVEPDVMALAKGLGGGFPVGACLTTAAVGDAMVVGTHGSTFGGNPLAMAVSNGVLDLLLEPGFLDEVANKGDYFKQSLAALVEKYPTVVQDVQGIGFMLGLVCKASNTEVLAGLRSHGLIAVTAGNNMIRLLPPLNMTRQDLDRGLAIIESSLHEIQASQ